MFTALAFAAGLPVGAFLFIGFIAFKKRDHMEIIKQMDQRGDKHAEALRKITRVQKIEQAHKMAEAALMRTGDI
ncbi:MAG: hypothetical protein Q7Q73_05760 [Verrucomicrobiota bacterium JB024]|nr:hypothetical protein [Verrucomicrobiota bacterium JB024]